jgi:hypothetical protein
LTMNFEKLLQEALAKATESLGAEAPPDVLYHYTSLPAVVAIIGAGTLHASDIRFLNDRTELQFAWGTANAVLKKLAASAPPGVSQEAISALASGPSHFLQLFGGAFAVSFSTQADLLSQWRAYADDGAGVALGLSVDQGFEVIGSTRASVTLSRIRYDEHDQADLLESSLRTISEAIARASKENDGAEAERIPWQAARQAVTSLVVGLAAWIKNPAFTEEQEWRAVVPYRGPFSPLDITDVRLAPRGLVPYCQIRPAAIAPIESRLPIKEIVLGPKINGLQEEAFFTYLAKQGYQAAEPGRLGRHDGVERKMVLIRRSRAPYR